MILSQKTYKNEIITILEEGFLMEEKEFLTICKVFLRILIIAD
jgi:hypothetical protein